MLPCARSDLIGVSIQVSLGLLVLVLLVIKILTRGEKKADEVEQQSGDDVAEKSYKALKNRYFAAYFLAIFGDWLQGPYVYRLYADYGYKENQIALLFVTGFGSSFLFGTFTGPLADKFGRKRLTLVFCVLYTLACGIKFVNNFWLLIVGRIFAGISTSLLFSVFEAWYIKQHRYVLKLPSNWIGETFATTTFASGVLAILAGICANLLTETLDYGPRAPFGLGIVCFVVCFLLVQFRWEENYGDRDNDLLGSYVEGYRQIAADSTILCLGMMQSIVEACMYIFVFLWTPVLTKPSPGGAASSNVPLGLAFSCFMICIMVGSSIFSAMAKTRSPLALLRISVATFGASIAVTSLTTGPSANEFYKLASYLSFLLLEVAVGIYFPSMGCLRSQFIPEDKRATITNWFRVPMNVITCFTLLAVNHPMVAEDKRAIFATCTGLLVTCGVVGARLERLVSAAKKAD